MVKIHSQNLGVAAKLQEEPDVFRDKETSLPPQQQPE